MIVRRRQGRNNFVKFYVISAILADSAAYIGGEERGKGVLKGMGWVVLRRGETIGVMQFLKFFKRP